jgi:hypothetical protein
MGAVRGVEGTVETALDIGSGIVGDVAGAATSVFTQDPKKGEKVSSALHMQPETESAKAMEKYVGEITAPLAKLIGIPEEKLKSSGHPILGQLYRAATDLAGSEIGSETVAGLKGIAKAATKPRELTAAEKVASRSGAEGALKGAAGKAKEETTQAYSTLEQALPPQTDVPLGNTYKVVQSHLGGIDTGFHGTAKAIEKKLKGAESATLDSVKELRTEVGQQINWGGKWTIADKKFKGIYDALTADMEAAAKAKGPQAFEAWQKANAANVASEAIGKKGMYNRLFRQDFQDVATVKRTVEQMGKYAPAFTDEVHRRMGLDPSSGEFNAVKFVRNYRRMPFETRQAVFGTKGKQYTSDLQRLVDDIQIIQNRAKTGKVNMPPGFHHMDFSRADIAIAAITAWVGGHMGIPHVIGFGAGLLIGKPIERAFADVQGVNALRNAADAMLKGGAEVSRGAIATGVSGEQVQ